MVVDYHAQNINFRWFNRAAAEERVGKYATSKAGILRQLEQAAREVDRSGKMIWIMESTTGWASEYSLDGTALFMEKYAAAASHTIIGSI
ncbi:MAG: hypothetical protein WBD75_10510 [Phycisphaerae bacterium]